MTHVRDRTSAFGRFERAIEDCEMLVLNMRSAFNRPRSIDVADNSVSLLVCIPQLEQRCGYSVVNDFDHSSADQLLVLHQSQIRLDAGSVAIHHETDGSGGSEDRHLSVSVAELLTQGESFVPA